MEKKADMMHLLIIYSKKSFRCLCLDHHLIIPLLSVLCLTLFPNTGSDPSAVTRRNRTENWDMKQVTSKQAIVLISPCDWFVIAVLFFSAQELNVSQNNPGITYNKVNAAEGKVRCTSLIPSGFFFCLKRKEIECHVFGFGFDVIMSSTIAEKMYIIM